MFQVAIKNQHFPTQGAPKFAQIGIFGLKRNHLATLSPTTISTMTMSMSI
jgi:hypothetical protein